MTEMDKVLYDKKIVYLDYLERGEKVKNGGFVKWESKGAESRVQVRVRGLYPTDTLQGEILLVSAGKLYRADRIGLQFGAGEYAGIWKNDDLAGTGLSFAECDGVQVQISDKRILRGQWRERAAIEQESIEPEPTGAARQENEPEVNTESKIQETSADPAEAEMQEASADPAVQPEAAHEEAACDQPIREPVREKPERAVIAGDKWEQLRRLYPKIRPFADRREFLSLTPRDFVVLAHGYHILVQNSFLLHGYYNYGHVVLTRKVNRGEEIFYLGVPGVYFEREKQAALMFGFEGFEAANEQAEEGGFGYYMKRVEI